jgi:hypothetical protein
MKKAVLNKDYLFIFSAPMPLAAAPVLNIKSETIDESVTLTAERSSLTISGVANDRRTLTISALASPLKPLQKDAFLITNSDSFFPVSINRISGTTLILGDALPKEFDITSVSYIQFATWHTVLSSADNFTTNSDILSLTVDYIGVFDDQQAPRIHKELLKVCARPFSTGLTHHIVLEQFPNFADTVARRQTDVNPQIEGGEQDLLLIVRDLLSSKELSEDEIHNPEHLRQAHLYFTGARIYEILGNFDLAEKLRTRAIELTDLAMKTIAIDTDGDGIVDTPEIDQRLKGGLRTDIRGNFAGRTIPDYENLWQPTRGMRF